jgi:hypothetical protein
MGRPQWSHSLATMISGPNSAGCLFVGLDEERSLHNRGAYPFLIWIWDAAARLNKH